MSRRILVVDDELVPQFPHWRHVTTAEAAFELLDSDTVDELWLRHDITGTAEVASLVELLLDEDRWEGRKIGLVVVPVTSLDAELASFETLLAKRGYAVRRELITPELFATSTNPTG